MQSKGFRNIVIGVVIGLLIVSLIGGVFYLRKNNADNQEFQEEKKCQSKKFSHKYSFVYETYDICKSKGNDNFNEVTDTVDDTIFAYDCEEIKDECGKTWYGVVFYKWNEDKKEYKFYY